MTKIKNILYVVLILWGLAGFFGMPIIFLLAEKYNLELPLSNPNFIVVDSLDNIYIGEGFYGVVQVYDKHGEYIKHWEFETFGGSSYADITEYGNIAIYPFRGWNPITRNKYELIYDLQGTLIIMNEIEQFNPLLEERSKTYIDQNGSFYKIGGFLFPWILKEGKLIFRQNALLNSLNMPQSLLISLIGIILLVSTNKETFNKIIDKIIE